MKIVSIFGAKLFAFHFKGEANDEFNRVLDEWNDPDWIIWFLKENAGDLPPGKDIEDFANEIMEAATQLDETIWHLSTDKGKSLDGFFKPLSNNEYRADVELSLKKGRETYLRIYAIKIESNCYVVTGGAIKLTLRMEERTHTAQELIKLDRGRAFLKENGVFDAESFFEFLNEEQ